MNIFKKKPTKEPKSPFSIEYYPLTNRYYPKYYKNYLKENIHTGIMETREPFLFTYADYGNTEQEAEKLIELFKEHQLKKNVLTIQK